MTPAVTVLMAVHNGERYLPEALASVADQTLADFEFLIIDDASSDATPRLLADAAAGDLRIRMLTNSANLGLTRSLNLGLQEARAPYIARFDADDAMLPDRLAVQHDFMEANPDHVGVCSGFDMVDRAGRLVRRSGETLDDWQVRWLMGWNPPAPHPTFFFRRLSANGSAHLYDPTFRTAQDYDFWARLADHGKTAVLPDVLLRYRRHAGAITHAKRQEQATNCALVGRRMIAARYPADVAGKLETLAALFAGERQGADRRAIAEAIGGADAMLAHDLTAVPSAHHRKWLKRTTAGLLAAAVLSRGGVLGSAGGVVQFLWQGRRHLFALAAAVACDPALARKVIAGRKG